MIFVGGEFACVNGEALGKSAGPAQSGGIAAGVLVSGGDPDLDVFVHNASLTTFNVLGSQ